MEEERGVVVMKNVNPREGRHWRRIATRRTVKRRPLSESPDNLNSTIIISSFLPRICTYLYICVLQYTPVYTLAYLHIPQIHICSFICKREIK